LYLEVYPDIIFIFNFIIDYILLFLLKKVNRKSSSIIRMAGASAAGAVAAVFVSIFPWMKPIIRFLILNVAAEYIMIFISFGRMKAVDLIKQMISLYLITFFAGGMINSIYYYTDLRERLINIGNSIIFSNLSWKFVMILIVSLIPITYLILWLNRICQSGRKETYEIELFFQNNSIQTKGLLDSGNCLYDPIFKKPVMVVENSIIKDLLPQEAYNELELAKDCMSDTKPDLKQPVIYSENTLRLKYIPYQSIGRARGMMPGLTLDRVLIHTGKETICNEKVTAAICDNHLSTKDDYHVLLHKELI
jgi:stage II sporulation protein GA (sporulation sigma-E factor processing peptidase)